LDPLDSRSLPGALWEQMPRSWILKEEALRDQLSAIDVFSFPWKQLRWLTETDMGIALTSAVLTIIWLLIHTASLKGQLQKHRGLLVAILFRNIILFGAFAGISDSVSNLIKLIIGRLKHHVNFYNPHVLPALSMPSNHAFNTACLLAIFMSLAPHRRLAEKIFNGALAAFVVFIGVSRILFSQHYPSDVILGWLLGFGLGSAFARLYRFMEKRFAINRANATQI